MDDHRPEEPPTVARTVEEVEAALTEIIDRQWYARSSMLAASGTDDPKAARIRETFESIYGAQNLGPYTDIEWGELRGRRDALQWILGEDWGTPQDR